jgi:hypothetical protein
MVEPPLRPRERSARTAWLSTGSVSRRTRTEGGQPCRPRNLSYVEEARSERLASVPPLGETMRGDHHVSLSLTYPGQLSEDR